MNFKTLVLIRLILSIYLRSILIAIMSSHGGHNLRLFVAMSPSESNDYITIVTVKTIVTRHVTIDCVQYFWVFTDSYLPLLHKTEMIHRLVCNYVVFPTVLPMEKRDNGDPSTASRCKYHHYKLQHHGQGHDDCIDIFYNV